MHYKVIFLIISSDDQEVYKHMKDYQTTIFNSYGDKIKYFFVENDETINDSITVEDNHIYIKGTDSLIPSVYLKSLKALNYIYSNYSFDYVIRTNLSSIWHIDNLFKFLDTQPKLKYAGGYAFQGFISGCGIIMSKDVSEIVFTNYNANYEKCSDDCCISETIQQNEISLYDIQAYKWGLLIENQNIKFPDNCRHINIDDDNDDFSDILLFRIKTSNRMVNDLYCFGKIIKKIYS
jgi:hypothetical protein